MNQISPIKQLSKTIELMSGKLSHFWTGEGDVSSFVRHTVSSVNKNPKLLNCDRQSLFMAIKDAARAGLMPDGVEGSFIPRGRTVNFEPQYHGLAKRSGWSHYKAFAVRENDLFEYHDSSKGCWYQFAKARGDRGEIQMAVCWSRHKDGFESMTVVDHEVLKEIERKASGKNPVWKSNREAMIIKTGVKQHAKYQIHEDMSIVSELNYEVDPAANEEVEINPEKPIDRLEELKIMAGENVDESTGEIK